MATLTTQVVNRGGAVPAYYSATSTGDAMACGSGMFLHAKNAGGSALTVTIVVPTARTYEPNVNITSPAISISNASEKMIGPIDYQTFADPTTGLASLTYSTSTSLTVTAIQLTQP